VFRTASNGVDRAPRGRGFTAAALVAAFVAGGVLGGAALAAFAYWPAAAAPPRAEPACA
jgi:hypothetical protein